MAEDSPKTTAPAEYENTTSGAKISGEVYKQLGKDLKARYAKIKKAPVKKTPPEAKK